MTPSNPNMSLIDEHEDLALEIGAMYLDNMASELGKKYQDIDYQLNAALTEYQHITLKNKHRMPAERYEELYNEFQKMEPTRHLTQVMDAFTASGGSVDIEPVYDKDAERLNVSVAFFIKDTKLKRIEGLMPMEVVFLKLNAMLQVDDLLSRSEPGSPPSF